MTNPFDPNYKSQIPAPSDGRRKPHHRKPPTDAARRHMNNLLVPKVEKPSKEK